MNRKRDGKDRRDDRSRERKDARRDLTSSSAAADKASRLRMDSYSDRNRRQSPPRRREMDNVMKKARRDGTDKSQYWNKKLLEVEEKDPNRWRHSGYKELYGERSSSQSKSRSRSRSPKAKSAKNSGRTRSPVPSAGRSRKSRSRSPVRKISRPQKRPPSPHKSRKSPHKRARSPSGSSDSGSSCTDDSCPVCSPKPTKRKQRSRSRSGSASRRRGPVKLNKPSSGPGSKSSATIGRKPLVKPSLSRTEGTKKSDKTSPPRDPRTTTTTTPSKQRKEPTSQDKTPPAKRIKMLAAVKIEGQKKPPPPPESDSDESSSSSEASVTEAPKMTLSERFGKMAQWSVDRRDVDYMKNMTITKESNSTSFKVVIDGPEEEDAYRPAAPEFSDRRTGAGYYPEAMHDAPYGLPSWDDIHVRFKYYKGQGYLHNLTLEDYMKWEEWWYKYQDWRDTERYYDQWAMSSRSHKPRRYRNKQNN